MKKNIFYLFCFLLISSQVKALEKCKWENKSGIPCLTIFSAPNTSKVSERSLGKIVITKKEIIDSGYEDVRSILEYIPGLDVFGDGPRGQKTSIFMRGTNSNHTLVLLNGIPINDQSSPKAMFDFGYDFIQGLQQIEVYKGASGAIFGPAAIGGAINFVTDIDYENSTTFNYSDTRNNSISGNYTYISDSGWHHNLKGGSTQTETNSVDPSQTEVDGTKNISLNYNSQKFLSDNLKFKIIGYARKTDSGYDHYADKEAEGTNIMYALQSNLESKNKNVEDKFTSHLHVYDRVYDEAEKNKYYSQSFTFKGERKVSLSDSLSYGIGSDYNYTKGDFQIHGTYGSSAKGHADNFGVFSNIGYKFDESTTFSAHLRGDSHKYSEENLTYRLNAIKLFNRLQISASQSTGLRHPDLYVLHGGNPGSSYYNGSFKAMLTTKPETSLTNEISGKYFFSDKLSLSTTAYKGAVSDVLNRSDSKGGYNETIDINQEGLETSLIFKDKKQKLNLTNTLSKSRESNGRPQLRRPEKQYGVSYFKKFKNSFLGPVEFNYNYRHIGKVEDWVGSVRKDVDSTDIMNISLSKDFYGNKWSLNIFNLTDEYYQRPYGYQQDRRRIGLSFRSKY